MFNVDSLKSGLAHRTASSRWLRYGIAIDGTLPVKRRFGHSYITDVSLEKSYIADIYLRWEAIKPPRNRGLLAGSRGIRGGVACQCSGRCLEVRYIQGGVRDKHGTLGDNRGQAARTIAKRLQPMQRAPGSPRQTESTSTNFQPGSKARPGHSLCNVEPQAPSSEAELLLCTVWSSPGQPSQPPSLPYARLDIAAMTIWIQHSLAQRSSVGGR